jgi:hypothetical protein
MLEKNMNRLWDNYEDMMMDEDLTQPNALPYVESVTTGAKINESATNDLLAAIEHADACINGCVHWVELHGDGSGEAFSEVYPDGIFGFSTVGEAIRKFNEVDAEFYEKLRARK